jgi:V/A-type H+-transporting ATPase subunit A
MEKVFDSEIEFASFEEARTFYLSLQNSIKNMNFTTFKSEKYQHAYKQIEDKVLHASKGSILV